MRYELAKMTAPDVEKQLETTDLVVVPTASIEQHGPHMPLAVDTIRAQVLGRRIADEMECFLAPVVRPGISAHHMAFVGTISLRESTFKAIVQDYCESLADHGFGQICVFTSHGGNTDALESLIPKLDDELPADVFVAGTRDGMMDARTSALEPFGVAPAEVGAHAGAAETAFLLETHPGLVDRTAAERGYTGEIEKSDIRAGLEAVTENGILGDATKASPEQGDRLIESCVEYLAGEIRIQSG